MKTNILAPTTNVMQAKTEVSKLLGRKPEERVGLGLFYGLTGIGKSAFAKRLGFSQGWFYYRIKKESTPKSLISAIYERLARRYKGCEHVPKRSAAALEEMTIELLAEHPETVLVIDEFNLATHFKRWALAELIRDLVDSSFATVLLVGEENTYAELKGYNKHYFDRSGFFYEFKPNQPADYQTWLDAVSEVKMPDGVAAWMHKRTEGNLRQAVKMLEDLELVAAANGLTEFKDLNQIISLAV